MATFLMILLLLVGLFLSLVILIQKGRGGGLAGAFGGAGGQSAFGTKAGDVFTKITIVVATIWFVLAGAAGIAINSNAGKQAEQFKQGETTLGTPEGAGSTEELEVSEPIDGESPMGAEGTEEAGSGTEVSSEADASEESTDAESPAAESKDEVEPNEEATKENGSEPAAK